MIREMKQLRKNNEKYEVYYHHPYTNRMWKAFFPRAAGQELGPKLLRHEPVPADIEKRLDICLGEEEPENAIGLGIEWSARPELWPIVFRILDRRYKYYRRSQLKRFLDNLHLKEARKELPVEEGGQHKYEGSISPDRVEKMIWISRKIRMKRFFVL